MGKRRMLHESYLLDDDKGYQKEDFRDVFQNCLSALRMAKEIVGGGFITATQPPEIIAGIKEKWIELFSRSEFLEVCRQCKGLCCSKSNFIMAPIELLHIIYQNHDFELPEPDWDFIDGKIENTINYPCLFLSKNGCLLKENKPYQCLFYACDSVKSKARNLEINFYSGDSENRYFIESKKEYAKDKDKRRISEEYSLWIQKILEYFRIVESQALIRGDLLFGRLSYPRGLEKLYKEVKKNEN